MLTSGRIRLTISKVHEPDEIVRPADHRNFYANDSQLELFEKEQPVPDNANFYCILLHVPDANEPRQPSAIQVVFPDQNCQSYVHSINLLSRHASLTESLKLSAETPTTQEIPLKLKETEKEKKTS